MARYERREVTTVTVEYTLKTPTNWVEVSKLLAGIRQDMIADGIDVDWDNIVTVDVGDDTIIFTYEKSRSISN